MTILQKSLTAFAIASCAGVAVQAARESSWTQASVQALERQRQRDTTEKNQIEARIGQAGSQLAALTSDNTWLRRRIATLEPDSEELAWLKVSQAKDQLQSLMVAWLARVGRLQRRLDQTPGAKIPEMKLLADQDWLNATRGDLETDTQYREALSKLRYTAQMKFCSTLQSGLSQYTKAHGQQFPTDISQLQDYLPATVDSTMLRRYAIMPATGDLAGMTMGNWLIQPKTQVDKDYDFRFTVTENGVALGFPYQSSPELYALEKAFEQANNGVPANDPSQLLPYAVTTEQQKLVHLQMEYRLKPAKKATAN